MLNQNVDRKLILRCLVLFGFIFIFGFWKTMITAVVLLAIYIAWLSRGDILKRIKDWNESYDYSGPIIGGGISSGSRKSNKSYLPKPEPTKKQKPLFGDKAFGPLWQGVTRQRTKQSNLSGVTHTKTYVRGKGFSFTHSIRTPTGVTTYKNGKIIRKVKKK